MCANLSAKASMALGVLATRCTEKHSVRLGAVPRPALATAQCSPEHFNDSPLVAKSENLKSWKHFWSVTLRLNDFVPMCINPELSFCTYENKCFR